MKSELVQQQPTVGSLVRYLTAESQHRLTDEASSDADRFKAWWKRLCAWPPNVFAVTSAILHESGVYRVGAMTPHDDSCVDAEKWLAEIQPVRPERSCCFLLQNSTPKLDKLGDALLRALDQPIEPQDSSCNEDLRRDILELHALADEASFAFGLPPAFVRKRTHSQPPHRNWPSQELVEACLERLCGLGTMSCFHPSKVRVLPKKHTPQVGITLRSLSLFIGSVRGEVKVRWMHPQLDKTYPADLVLHDSERLVNLLLVPWPYQLQASAFKAVGEAEPYEFTFSVHGGDYDGGNLGPLAYVRGLLNEAKRRDVKIDGVIFPELSLSPEQFEDVRNYLKTESARTFLLGGVGIPEAPSQLPSNQAWLELGAEEPAKQEKHHKWSIDAGQIRQYHLGAALLAEDGRRYWERMKVGPRTITFAQIRPNLTLCPLICEDLARVEPVAEVIRGVGPNLVIALLLDGPQLEKRWPGRYASIFADDPGSSVLTLSPLGFVRRSRGRDDKESSVVALWKDQRTGTREISLTVGSHALILSLATNLTKEFAFDRRDDGGSTGVLTFAGIEEIRLSAAQLEAEKPTLKAASGGA